MIHVPKQIIDFKDEQTRSEFKKVKPRLQVFILAAGSFMYFTYGVTLVVTDLLRTNKKSVHYHGNGVDFRTRDLTDEQGDALVEFLKWQLPYYMKTPTPTNVKRPVQNTSTKEQGSW